MAVKRLKNAKKPIPKATLDKRTTAAYLMAQGQSNEEISKQLKVHYVTVSGWRTEPQIVEIVARLHAEAHEQTRALLASGQATAARNLIAKVSNENAPGSESAQKLLLNLTGHTATQKVEQTVTVTPLPDERVIPELIAALTALVSALDPTERAALRPDVDTLRRLL